MTQQEAATVVAIFEKELRDFYAASKSKHACVRFELALYRDGMDSGSLETAKPAVEFEIYSQGHGIFKGSDPETAYQKAMESHSPSGLITQAEHLETEAKRLRLAAQEGI